MHTSKLLTFFLDEVRMPNIVKSPNKTYYVIGEDNSITLTCKSDGNPKPIYQWYQENHNESIDTKENLTIMDINVTNSEVYTCNVSNFFNGYTFQNTTSVQINIVNKGKLSLQRLVHIFNIMLISS